MRKYKFSGLAGAVALLACGSAMAADLPQRTEAPPPVPVAAPIFTWTGFYVGGNVGWGAVHSDRVGLRFNGVPVAPNNFGKANGTGVLGGVQAGYNWQVNSLVFGVEADIQAAGINKSVIGAGGVATRAKVNWFGTVRGRLGYAFDRTLLYATGGLAYTNIGYRMAAPGPGLLINSNTTRWGWTVGGGVEDAFTRNWSAKLEYLYVNSGKYRATGFNGGTWSTTPSQDFHVVRAGLNYRC